MIAFWKSKWNNKQKKIRYGASALLILLGIIIYHAIPIPVVDSEEGEAIRVSADQPFVIHFSQSMHKESVEKAFKIIPKIPGEFKWENSKTLHYFPNQLLDLGDQYRVSIGQQAKNIYQKTFNQRVQLNFEVTGPPSVAFVYPQADPNPIISPNQSITVQFDRPMSQEEGQSPLQIQPSVKGTGEWISESVFQFNPTAWPMATRYKLTIPTGLPARDGGETTEDYSWEIKTPALKIIRTSPAPEQGVNDVNQAITVHFNQPIDLEQIRPGDNILLFPSNDADAQAQLKNDGFFNTEVIYGEDEKGGVDKSTLIFRPTFPYLANQDYRLVFKAGLAPLLGDLNMTEDWELGFEIQEPEDNENFGPHPEGEFQLSGLRFYPNQPQRSFGETDALIFDIEGVHVDAVNINFCSLSTGDFFEFEENFKWQQYHCNDANKFTETLLKKVDSKGVVKIDLNNHSKTPFKSGAYVITVDDRNGESRLVHPFLISNIGLTIKKSTQELLVWVVDRKQGNPLSGMEIALFSRAGKLLEQGLTDKQGLHRFKGDFETGVYIQASKKEAAQLWWGLLNDAWQMNSVSNPRNEKVYLQTNGNTFKKGESLHFTGVIRQKKADQWGFYEQGLLKATLTDDYQENSHSIELSRGAFGLFWGKITIPADIPRGRYSLTIDTSQNQFSVPIVIEESYGEGLELKITESPKQIGMHKELKFQWQAFSKKGMLLSDLSGKWQLKKSSSVIAGESFYLNSHGKASIEIQPKNFNLTPGTYQFEVEMENPEGAPLLQQREFQLHAGSYNIDLSLKKKWVYAGEELDLSTAAMNWQAQPIPDKKITLSLYEDSGESVKPFFKKTLQTQASPIFLTIPTSATMQGKYWLVATGEDEYGNSIESRSPIFIASIAQGKRFETLQLIPDQSEYLVGGKAKLLLIPPKHWKEEKKALITYHQNHIVDHEVVTLKPEMQELEVWIQESMVPNVWVSVDVWSDLLQAPQQSQVNLNVSSRDHQIQLDVDTHLTQRSGQKELIVKALTYDYQNRNLNTHLSLNVLQFNGENQQQKLQNPLNTFYEKQEGRLKSTPIFEPQAATQVISRKILKTIEGAGETNLVLPDDFKRGVLQIIALKDENQFGALQIPLELEKTLIINPLVPLSAVSGDRFEIQADLINGTGRDLQTQIELIAPEVIIEGSKKKSVHLKEGETTSVKWIGQILPTKDAQINLAFRTRETFATATIKLQGAFYSYSTSLPEVVGGIIKERLSDPDFEGQERLKNFRRQNGGYALWSQQAETDSLATAYSLLGTNKANQESVQYLWNAVSNPALPTTHAAFIGWALSEVGQYDTPFTLQLFKDRKTLSADGKAFLLMTIENLIEANQKSLQPFAERLKKNVVEHAIQDGEKTYFVPQEGSLIKDFVGLNGLMLMALESGQDHNPFSKKIIETVRGGMQNSVWSTWGLKRYQNHEAEPMEVAEEDANIKSITSPLINSGQDLTIIRNYSAYKNALSLSSSWPQGELIRGKLKIIVPEEKKYIVIEESLPAGAQVLAFESSSEMYEEEKKAQQQGYSVHANPLWHFDHQEIEGNQLRLFAKNLPAGVYTLQFVAEAMQKGSFTHLPTRVYHLFSPNLPSEIGAELIEIK